MSAERTAAHGLRTFLVLALVLAGAVAVVVLALRLLDEDRASGVCVARAGDLDGTLDEDQADNAALMAAIATRRDLPARATTIAIATALQESKLRNIDYGDRDSVGLFQQRPSQGWGTVEEIMDPVYATNAFYDVLVSIEGFEGLQITDAAQQVQRSAFPDAYAQHETRARAFASALSGHSPAALTCHLAAVPAEDRTPSATARELTARLERDYGLTPAVDPSGALVVDAAPLAGTDAATAAWGVAQWAVATAAATGVHTVAVDGQVWQRAGDESTWVSLDGAPPAPAGPGRRGGAGTGPGAGVLRVRRPSRPSSRAARPSDAQRWSMGT